MLILVVPGHFPSNFWVNKTTHRYKKTYSQTHSIFIREKS